MDDRHEAPEDGATPTQEVHPDQIPSPPRSALNGIAELLGPLAARLGLPLTASEEAKRLALKHEEERARERARQGMLPPGKLPPRETTPLDPSLVSRITAKVRGKPVLAREIAPGQGTEIYKVLLAMSEEHGRTLVVTCHMRDGSKQRYRGHGTRLAAKTKHVPSFVVDPAPEMLHEPPHLWRIGDTAEIQTDGNHPKLVTVVGFNATDSKVRCRFLDDEGKPYGPPRSIRPHRLSVPEEA